MEIDIENRKNNLIDKIKNLQNHDKDLLDFVEKLIKNYQSLYENENLEVKSNRHFVNEDPLKSITPIKESITLQKIADGQNYKPIHKDEFYGKVQQLKIEESLDELLAMLD